MQNVCFAREAKMAHQDTGKEDECNPQRYPENLNLTQQYAHGYNECIQANDMCDGCRVPKKTF